MSACSPPLYALCVVGALFALARLIVPHAVAHHAALPPPPPPPPQPPLRLHVANSFHVAEVPAAAG